MLLALIIIGPKDLPRVARTIGQWVRKGRMLAREFQTSLEDMAKETELDDVRKEIEKVGRTDLKKSVENVIDPKGELSKAFDTSETKETAGGEADSQNEIAKPASDANGHAGGDPAETSAKTGTDKSAANADLSPSDKDGGQAMAAKSS